MLAPTLVRRQGIELFRADDIPAARLLSSTLDPQAILVDRDLADVRAFIQALRQEPATRRRSLAVLARGPVQDLERELLEAGANAVLRLPPDASWDEPLSRLLAVAARHDARLLVRLEIETEPEGSGAIVNLSAGGMLLASHHDLRVNDEIGFRFKLPDGTTVAGRGRVARQAKPIGHGVQFIGLDEATKQAIQQFLRTAQLG